MKPRKLILTAAAITALFSAGGCDLNNNVCVYGPPPDDYTTRRPYAAEPVQSQEQSSETAETCDTSDTAESVGALQEQEEQS